MYLSRERSHCYLPRRSLNHAPQPSSWGISSWLVAEPVSPPSHEDHRYAVELLLSCVPGRGQNSATQQRLQICITQVRFGLVVELFCHHGDLGPEHGLPFRCEGAFASPIVGSPAEGITFVNDDPQLLAAGRAPAGTRCGGIGSLRGSGCPPALGDSR